MNDYAVSGRMCQRRRKFKNVLNPLLIKIYDLYFNWALTFVVISKAQLEIKQNSANSSDFLSALEQNQKVDVGTASGFSQGVATKQEQTMNRFPILCCE